MATLVMAILSWGWLQSSSSWDIFETISTSGRVQYVFESIPEKYQVPFVIGYGLTQPVLPAAIVDPACRSGGRLQFCGELVGMQLHHCWFMPSWQPGRQKNR